MKIVKKSMPNSAGASATGGAAIADRFKLDAVAPQTAQRTVNQKAALWALIFGFIALTVTGILTYVLYDHWQFLMPR